MMHLLVITLQDCISQNMTDQCSNHGDCINENGIEQCQCYTGYDGNYCEKCSQNFSTIDNTTTCYSKHCIKNNKVCNETTYCAQNKGHFLCECKIGYTGNNCSQCASGYTMIKSNCIDNNLIINNSVCSGHGVVENNGTSQTCNCTEPYTGQICNQCMDGFIMSQDNLTRCVNIDKCIDNTTQRECSGHGYCESDRKNQYGCKCINHFKGLKCDECPKNYGLAPLESDPNVHPLKDKCIPETCFNATEYNKSNNVYQNVSECTDRGYCFNFLNNNVVFDKVIQKVIDQINNQFGLNLTPNGCICRQQHMNAICSACTEGYRKHIENATSVERYFGQYDTNEPLKDETFTCKMDRCTNKCNNNGKCLYNAHYDEYRCECDNNYNPYDACNTCINHFSLESKCTQCKPGYDINVLCAHCELGRDESTQCTTCLPNYKEENGSCAQCEHNMDINKRCQECPDNMYTNAYGDCSMQTTSSSKVGIAIGIILAIVVLIAIITVVVILVRRKKAKKFTNVNELRPLIN